MAARLTNVTSLSGNGLRDWLIQRITSVILGFYIIFLVGFLLFHPSLDYLNWQGLFLNPFMRIFTILALISLLLHAWIGMWTIATDYLKVTSVRLLFQIAVILVLLGYFIWGIEILFK